MSGKCSGGLGFATPFGAEYGFARDNPLRHLVAVARYWLLLKLKV